jgi:rod shape determining protein RodA
MKVISSFFKRDPGLIMGMGFLMVFSNLVLRSTADYLFPNYYIYILIGIIFFIVFSLIDFEVFEVFSWYLYIFSVLLLIVNFIIGQVTRGVVRWIEVGGFSIQPSEIVKPFLLVFFATYLTRVRVDTKRFIRALILFSIPTLLILIQPSLGVAVLMAVGFGGVVLTLDFDKRILITAVLFLLMFLPLSYLILAPYQKGRINALINPSSDPYGAGYNSIQAKIAVGSGKLFGRGLGQGVQTQLSFLPEMHTDFIFASIGEELGLVGAILIIMASFFLLWRLIQIIMRTNSLAGRSFVSGVFLMLFAQDFIHIGMNMGIMPITGIPLPLVSAGGSSILATMIMLGMCLSSKKS